MRYVQSDVTGLKMKRTCHLRNLACVSSPRLWLSMIKVTELVYNHGNLIYVFRYAWLEELTEMRKQMKTMEEKNASYMQQTIDLQEVRDQIYSTQCS